MTKTIVEEVNLSGQKYKVVINLEKEKDYHLYHGGFSGGSRSSKINADVDVYRDGEILRSFEKVKLSKENFGFIERLLMGKGYTEKDMVEEVLEELEQKSESISKG